MTDAGLWEQHIVGENAIRVRVNVPTQLGALSVKDERIREIMEWCEQNCRHSWIMSYDHFSFRSEDDAMLFRLTWL